MAAYYTTDKVEKQKRNEKIMEMRGKGYSFLDIGNHFCITAERARQINVKMLRKKDREKDSLKVE